MPSCRRCHWRNVTRALSCSTWSLPIRQHLCLSKQWRSSATRSIRPDVPQSHQPWSQSQPYFEAVKHWTTTMQNVTITSYIMVINYVTTLYLIKTIIVNLQIVLMFWILKTAFYKACSNLGGCQALVPTDSSPSTNTSLSAACPRPHHSKTELQVWGASRGTAAFLPFWPVWVNWREVGSIPQSHQSPQPSQTLSL